MIPRTAIYLRRGEAYLLIKGAKTKRHWPGKFNGVGGHIERNEDILSAARRELLEETGLEADLWLCGVVMVNAGEVGICLYVFSGVTKKGKLRDSAEGTAEWITYDRLKDLPVVEDVPILLSKIHKMKSGDPPFSARSYYDVQGKLILEFEE